MTERNAPEAPVAYWPPDAALARYVTGYHRYRVNMPPGTEMRDVLFPSWGTLRFSLDDPAPWSIARGPRTFDPMPEAALDGPSSYAGYTRATRGTTVGVGILPSGWAWLIGRDAAAFANRVVPLDTVFADAPALHAALAAAPSPKPVLDAWLLAKFAGLGEVDPVIARLEAMLDDPAITRIEMIEEALGVSGRALGKIAKRHFGFTPKLLLRRKRFLRALAAVLAGQGNGGEVALEAGYWDRSHFLRDSNQFLGCSIREFRTRQGPLNAMAMRVRAEVLGAAV